MQETEIERLVVRLTGDASQYVNATRVAEDATNQYARAVDGQLRDAQGRFLKGHKLLEAQLRQTNNGWERGAVRMRHYSAQLQMIGKQASAVGQRMGQMGRTMSMRVTLPIVAFGGLAIKTFADFDQAMTESVSIMNVTANQAKRMRDTALELSPTSVQSPKDLAKSYFYLASAGKDAEQSMALLPPLMQFATAGAFDMATAVDLLTDAQSALGLSSKNAVEDAKNMTRLANVLVGANTLANASVQQFSESLTNTAGSTFKAFNKSVEEGVSLLAAYADQGLKGAVAGTTATRVTLLLAKSARDAAKEHERLGFKVYDAAGNMRHYGDIVKNLEDIMRGMTTEQKAATLAALGFEARIQQAILPLLGTSAAIKLYNEKLLLMGKITEEVAAKQLTSFSNKFSMLWNTIQTRLIQAGEMMRPTIDKIIAQVYKAIAVWDSFSDQTKVYIGIVLAAAAAIGPILVGLGLLVAVAGAAITGLGAIGGALAVLFTPVGAIVAGVVAAVAGLAAGIAWLQSETGFLNTSLALMVSIARSAWDVLQNKLWPALLRLWVAAKQLALGIGEALKTAFEALEPVIRASAAAFEWVLLRAIDMVVGKVERLVWLIELGAKGLRMLGVEIPEAATAPPPAASSGAPKESYVDKLKAELAKVNEEINKAQAEADKNRAANLLEDENKELATFITNLKKEAETVNMTAGQLAYYEAKANGASEAERQWAQQITEWTAAQQKAHDEAKQLQDSVESLSKDFLTQAMTVGMSAREVRIFTLQMQGAKGAEIEMASKMAKRLDMMDKARQITDKFKSSEQKLEETRRELDTLLNANMISLETYTMALADAEKQTNKDYTAKFNVEGVGAVLAGSFEAEQRLNEYVANLQKSFDETAPARRAAQARANQRVPLDQMAGGRIVGASAAGSSAAPRSEEYLKELLDLARIHWTGNVVQLEGAGLD